MDVEQSVTADVTVLKLIGRLDVPGSQVALEAVLTALTPGTNLVLDMSHCIYVASSGLRTLLIAAKQAARIGGQVVIAAPQPLVLDIITMAGFAEVLRIYSTLPEAISTIHHPSAIADTDGANLGHNSARLAT